MTSSCLPVLQDNASSIESSADNNIKPSLAAATEDNDNNDTDGSSPPSQQSCDKTCLQCCDNNQDQDETNGLSSGPSTTTTTTATVLFSSQPPWQQQGEPTSSPTQKEDIDPIMTTTNGSFHTAETNDEKSLPTINPKHAGKSPRLENSWMRVSNPMLSSMMVGDHGQSSTTTASSIHDSLKTDDDGMGVETITNNDNGDREQRINDLCGNDHVNDDDSGGIMQEGRNMNGDNRSGGGSGGIDDAAADAIEAMLAMASPTSKPILSSSTALPETHQHWDGNSEEGNATDAEMKKRDESKGEGVDDGALGGLNVRPHATKTLALVRKSYELNMQHRAEASCTTTAAAAATTTTTVTTTANLDPPLHPPKKTTTSTTTTKKIEFLSPQKSKDGRKNFYQRVSVPGDIMSRIDAIPSDHHGMIGLGNNPIELNSASSLEVMNGMYPTNKSRRWESSKSKEKKGKKRGHDKISITDKESLLSGKSAPEPKPKRSRGDRKSKGKGKGKKATFADSPSHLTIDHPRANYDETKPQLPSPIRILHPPKNPTSMFRTLPEFTPQPQQYTITTDHRPHRIYNPLLQLPHFPDGSDPPLEEVPQAGELWNISDIHFHDPDTYPISYLARVLGFHVPVDGNGQEFGQPFDPMALERCREEGEQDAMMIPERGSFSVRIWKGRRPNNKQSCSTSDGNGGGYLSLATAAAARGIDYDHDGMHDDRKLTYSDPLYTNILSSYRGYNGDDFKDAGKGYLDEISPHCLEFARQRGVLRDAGLSFRFASDRDEEMLTLLAEKCQWKSHPKHDIATCLRSQSHFCIVAESTSSDGNRTPISFLQYRFCWYKVEEKRVGNASTEKVAELVIFIDNLVYADADNAAATGGEELTSTQVSNEFETAKVLLLSLALIHACRSNIWFGMTDSPSALVPFFIKYFRMSNVNRDGVSSVNDAASTVPLVLDIKKCHFKYAILLLEESFMPGRKENSRDVYSERMLVELRAETSNTTGEAAQLDGRVFSNSFNDNEILKKAHVRLMRKPDTAEIFSVSTTDYDGEEVKEALNPIGSLVNDVPADWNIVRLFPLDETSTGERATKSDSVDVAEEIFLAELKKKQSELLALESSVESTVREILSKAYGEHLNFVDSAQRAKRVSDEKKLKEYQTVQKRLQEAELAWQAQLDQDMDAVCDVCFDGEVTPENQIIFCDACNVAVHQRCYGIDQIPSGNYFCRTCTHFEIDKEYLAAKRRDGPPLKITRHPIVCELCPRRQGAFVQVLSTAPTSKARWVHVGCAKWQGMNYVDDEKNIIEDLTELKQFFKAQGISCSLCKGTMGALHQCREEGCEKWFHLTCARSFGKCSVQHGENCEGYHDPETLSNPPWTLGCPSHSEIDPDAVQEGILPSLTTEQLMAIAESYPPEPVPPKSFTKMTATERKEYWSDKEKLLEFFGRVTASLDGDKCAVCEFPPDPIIDKRCDKCGVLSHADCADPARGERATCLTCRFTEAHSNDTTYEEPRCYMCCHPNSVGPLVRATAKPISMKKWKTNLPSFQRSIFGKNKFCHALCGLWNPDCRTIDGLDTTIDCTNIAMSNGKDFVGHQCRCSLCGLHQGAKVTCSIYGCDGPVGARKKAMYHITCARQAGLEVKHDGDFSLKCFMHVDCSFVFRARLEDLKEIELNRSTSKAFKPYTPITWIHASSLLHASVAILRTLGWAWRWAEWWVASGDNWEPLLEEGQVEEEMTEDELKIVHSTEESRCRDARQCRLAAFGAALRNRDYDKEDGDDQEPLERALTAVLSTKSLVGPLRKKEIDFFVTWLALAYRSKSPVLGFGDDKTPVADDSFCVHQDDGTPKYELGSRPLPGKAELEKGVFEPPVVEVDDFLKSPLPSPAKKVTKRKKSIDNEAEATP